MKKTYLVAVTTLACVASMLSVSATAQSAPSNDEIQNAVRADSNGNNGFGFEFLDQTNVGATNDRTSGAVSDTNPLNSFNRALDDGSNFGQSGVWYRWTSAVSQPMIIEISRAEGTDAQTPFDPTLAIFEHESATFDPGNGSPSDLDQIVPDFLIAGLNDDLSTSDTKSRVEFSAREGYEYWILVGGHNRSQGTFDIRSKPSFDTIDQPVELLVQSALNATTSGGAPYNSLQFARNASPRATSAQQNLIYLSSKNAINNTIFVRFRPPNENWGFGFALPTGASFANEDIIIRQANFIERTASRTETRSPIPDPGTSDPYFFVEACAGALVTQAAIVASDSDGDGQPGPDLTLDKCYSVKESDVGITQQSEFVLELRLPSGVEQIGILGGTVNLTDADVSPVELKYQVNENGDLGVYVGQELIAVGLNVLNERLTITPPGPTAATETPRVLDGAFAQIDYEQSGGLTDWLSFSNGTDGIEVNGPESFRVLLDGQKLQERPFAELRANVTLRGYEERSTTVANCPPFPGGFVLNGKCFEDTAASDVIRPIVVFAQGVSKGADRFAISPDETFSTDENTLTKSFSISLQKNDGTEPGTAQLQLSRGAEDWFRLSSALEDCNSISATCVITLSGNKVFEFDVVIDQANLPAATATASILLETLEATFNQSTQIDVTFNVATSPPPTTPAPTTPPTMPGASGGGGGGCTVAAPGADGDPTLLLLLLLAMAGLSWRKINARSASQVAHSKIS